MHMMYGYSLGLVAFQAASRHRGQASMPYIRAKSTGNLGKPAEPTLIYKLSRPGGVLYITAEGMVG